MGKFSGWFDRRGSQEESRGCEDDEGEKEPAVSLIVALCCQQRCRRPCEGDELGDTSRREGRRGQACLTDSTFV